MKELVICATTENLPVVLDFIDKELDNKGYDNKVKNLIYTAVEEIFVNIAYYAYKPLSGDATIRIWTENGICIAFEDNGVRYNPLAKADPDIGLSIDEREIGGLGIYMVKKIMDSVEYRYEDNKNILTIKKNMC